MKISLVQCPVWGTYDPPMALALLAGSLNKAGYKAFAFDLNIKLYRSRTENYKNMWAWEQSSFWYSEENVDDFFSCNKPFIDTCVNKVIDTGSKVVGFSVNAASRISSLKLARMIKEINKEIVVIFGGPLFFEKDFVQSVLEEEAVDIVLTVEAELSFPELLGLLEKNKDLSACRGVAYKQRGRIVDTGLREPLVDLDLLPFLDFSGLPLSDYDDDRHIVFMTSRGCIQRCAFCSSRAFWPGYRAMSGRRIFKEIEFHKRALSRDYPDFSHIDFIDLLFNGNMRSLEDFCSLLIKSRLHIFWTANMIIRPEMNEKIIKKMYASGCEHIIFGIESGSQRILDSMRKSYRIEDADRIIKCMHKAGIKVTANFMFGFPQETERDFCETLDFIKRNAGYLDRVYPSRTFFAVEEFSYLSSHLIEFGINPDIPNHLYWETFDGNNTYPERLRRCEEFCALASSLGIEVGSGVQTSVELDRFFNLGNYYEYKGDFKKALEYFLDYYRLDKRNEAVLNKIRYYAKQLEMKSRDFGITEELKDKIRILIPALY